MEWLCIYWNWLFLLSGLGGRAEYLCSWEQCISVDLAEGLRGVLSSLSSGFAHQQALSMPDEGRVL